MKKFFLFIITINQIFTNSITLNIQNLNQSCFNSNNFNILTHFQNGNFYKKTFEIKNEKFLIYGFEFQIIDTNTIKFSTNFIEKIIITNESKNKIQLENETNILLIKISEDNICLFSFLNKNNENQLNFTALMEISFLDTITNNVKSYISNFSNKINFISKPSYEKVKTS